MHNDRVNTWISKQRSRARAPWMGMLLCMALLAGQAFAEQHIHLNDEASATCTVCAHTLDHDGATAAGKALAAEDIGTRSYVPTLQSRDSSRPQRFFLSRAPPSS